jgi:hypothetical protein
VTEGRRDSPPQDFTTHSMMMSVKRLLDLIRSGALDLDASYQRRDSWDKQNKSAFIESALLALPLGSLIFVEEPHGRLAVVDGKQRLLSLKQFRDNAFALTHLRLTSKLNGLRFQELPRLDQDMLMDTQVWVLVLEGADIRTLNEVFLRMNTSGQQLSQQEVRNVRFSGPLNDTLKDLADNPFLRMQFGAGEQNSTRYADMSNVEYVLRFLALSEKEVAFEKSISALMDGFMARHVRANGSQVREYAIRFISSIGVCEELWGDLAFRRHDRRLGWRRPAVATVYDAQMLACAELPGDTLHVLSNRTNGVLSATMDLFETQLTAFAASAPNTPAAAKNRAALFARMLTAVASEL